MGDDASHNYNDYIAAVAASKDRSRFDRAEAMTFGERLLVGADLFDMGTMMMRTGIRMDHPHATDTEVEQILVERLRISRGHEVQH